MIKSEYQILSRKIDENKKATQDVQNDINTLSGDLTVDRQDIDDLKRKQGDIGIKLTSILEKLNRMEADQKNAIQVEISKAMEREVSPLRKTLNSFINSKKKIIMIKEKFNLIGFVMRGFRGAKDELIREISEEEVKV